MVVLKSVLVHFMDGDSDVKDLINSYNQDRQWWTLAWKSLQVFDSIREEFGLNPGKEFHKWLKQLLKSKDVDTLEKLQALREQGD